MILVYFILILVILIDLILYIPLKFHMYQDSNCIYLYFYSLPIIKIDNNSNFNMLKGKVNIDKVIDTDKEDLKIINSFKIEKIYIRINKNNALENANVFYPLLSINNLITILDYDISYKTKFYSIVSFKLSNIIFKLLTIRRNKSERTSNK